MKARLTIKLGNKTLVIEGDGDSKTIIKNIGFWSRIPEVCGNCGSDQIGLSHKAPKGNDYYGLQCTKCTAEYNFGQFKAGGFYIKNEGWSVWDGAKGETSSRPPEGNEPPPVNDDDLEF